MTFEYFPLSLAQVNHRRTVWDGLAARRPFGRAAVCDCPKPDFDEVGRDLPSEDQIPLKGSVDKNPKWDIEIRKQIHSLHTAALSRFQDDSFPAIAIPRSIHGQSQAFAEMFGCKLVPQVTEKDLIFPVPWIETPADLERLKLIPVEQCLYGRAIDFTQYVTEVTGGDLAVRNPVMTGPLDCANYILGSMKLMQWIYDEPAALHRLLSIITDVIIDTIHKLQTAANNRLCPDHCTCLNRGFALCSEVRELISAETYGEFESPYLRRIGKECGSYMFHSCGTWERTLLLDMEDENLMMIHFQTKEMNLAKVYEFTQGNLSLYVGRSINLGDKYLWGDETSFYKYLIQAFPEPVPLSFTISDIESYLSVQNDLKGGPSGMFQWKPGSN